MSAAYTPGPWRVEKIAENDVYRILASTETAPKVICAYWFDDEGAANATLIAAAPDLLEAVVKARNTLAGCGMAAIAANICDAAIAKATGA